MDSVTWGAPSFWIERFPLYWGIEKGIFAGRGIDLAIWYSHGGPELARAVSEGRLHVGEMGLPPFATAFAAGLPARIIGSSVIRRLDHYLAAVPGIDALPDLGGRRIGILSPGSCDDYFIRRMLAEVGLDADRDVELVALGEAYGSLEVFADGRVDAAFVVEPRLSRGEEEGILRVVARVADHYPRYQWGIILASDAWIGGRRALLERLLDAFRAACRSIRENPADTFALGGRVFGMDPRTFGRALMRDLPRWEFDARLDAEGIDCALDVQKALGALSADVSADGMVAAL